jgi:hypothetical protein
VGDANSQGRFRCYFVPELADERLDPETLDGDRRAARFAFHPRARNSAKPPVFLDFGKIGIELVEERRDIPR